MPKLNGGSVNARTNSALPNHHLPYDEQRLDTYGAYSADSAVEAELPDSPLTKQLREDQERQNNSQQHAAAPKQFEIKLLERPSSGGHDIQARGFALLPPPKVKARAAHAAKPTKFSFAPIHTKVDNVQDGSVQQDRPGSRIPATSPQPGTSLQVHVSQMACSVSESREVVSTKAEKHDAITITSDPAQSVAEDNIQDEENSEEPEADQVVVALETIDGTTLTETTVQEALVAGSQLRGTPDNVQSLPQHLPAPAPNTFVGGNGGAEETVTAAIPSAAPGSLSTPRTPKKHHPTPVLVSPAGVGKARHLAQNMTSGPKHVQMTPESAPPSEEDLLFVLMHRCRERGDATKRSMTKIKTLEHRNFELHKKTQVICQERDNAIAAQTETSEKYSSLQTSIESFKSKYSKLKDFARCTHQDLLLLRQSADAQKVTFRDLKQIGDQVQTSLRDASASVEIVQTSLNKQKQGLAVIRFDADRIFSDSTHTSARLSANSGRIKELTQDKGRLEGHIVSLENAQQRATQAARDSNRDVSTALAKVTQRLDGIEVAALRPPESSDAAQQCLVLLQNLQQGKETTAKDLQELAKSVTVLRKKVVKSVKSIGGDYQKLQMAQRAEQSGEVVEQLKQYVDGLQLSTSELQQSNEERVRLEALLKGSRDVIEELQKSVAQANSYVATFQLGMQTMSGTSNAQKERQTQLQTQTDQFQVKYNSKCSELASVKQELADKSEAMVKEVARLQALWTAEESKRIALEEDLSTARQNNVEAVNENNQDLRTKLNETNAALESAKASGLATKKEADELTAQLKQELETLQQSHKTLQSTSQTVQSDVEKLRQERESLRGELDIALQQSAGAEKLKEQLKDVQARCEQANNEVEQLRSTRSELSELREQFEMQHKDANSKTAEFNRVQQQLIATEKYPETIENLKKDLKTAEHDVKSLQEKLTEATAKVVQVGDLQARLSSTTTSVEKLEMEVNAARETRHKLEAVSKEKDLLADDVTKLRNDLATAQQQIQKTAGLEECLRERDEEIARLRQQADRAQALSESLSAQSEASQQKESEIASLRGELQRIKVGSQESADAQAINADSQPAELEGFATQQSNISFLQESQTRHPIGDQSNVHDHSGIQDGERPQRKVADRSAQRKSTRPLRPLSPIDLKGSQPQSTSSTNVVPNSQMDTHLREALGMYEADDNNHEGSLPQSAARNDNEGHTGVGMEEDGSSQPEIPETLQDNLRPLQEAQGLHNQTDTLADREVNAARPSSSAASVDLFKQHENNLDAATQPWTGSQPSVKTPDHSRSIRGHGHPKSTLQSTIAPNQLHFHPINAVSAGVISPKSTRSGMPFRERFVTPTRESGPGHIQGTMEITPPIHKERHQPNSAVKRSAEGDGPPAKRLERHPERLAVRMPSKPTNHLASGSSQSNVTPASRKGGSVVGTPAPAPGKSQKSARAPRKSSKRDKYSAKFVESS